MSQITFSALPSPLIKLLAEFENGRSFSDEIAQLYAESAEFRLVLDKIFQETIQKSGLNSLCKVLGNQAVRDRLILAYMNRLAGGYYLQATKIRDIKDILWFEDIIRPYTTDGHWRHVMFAVYLKSMEIESGQQDSSDDSLVVTIEKKIRPFISLIRGKSAKIDWICLMIWQYVEMLGADKVSHLLRANASYETISKELNEEQKRLLINNCLTYSMSIGEADIFSSIILPGNNAIQV